MARVLFIQTDWLEHLGTLYLSAVLKRGGHECSLLITHNSSKAVKAVLDYEPDIVAMSATTGSHYSVLEIGQAIKNQASSLKSQVLIALGGPHATFFPEVINEPSLDLICRGEGEDPLQELCRRIDQGEDFTDVPGLWVKTDTKIYENQLALLIKDLDTLPFPNRSLYTDSYPVFRKVSMKRVIFSRGCPYNCTYCFNQSLKELTKGLGPYLRLRSVDNTIEELRLLKEAGARTINVSDDTFAFKRNWALEFLNRYKSEIQIPFIINARAELLDEDLTIKLAEAGCYCVQIGVESGSPVIRTRTGMPGPPGSIDARAGAG